MTENTATRPSLRQEVAAFTESRIMEGVANLMRGGADITFDRVAKESGVPLRTLYRYFENREALFGAFWRWTNELIEVPAPPTTPEAVVSHISALFAAFDRDEPLVRAMLHDPHGRAVRIANADKRRKKFADALRPVTETLPEAEATRLLASVTALCSAAGWETMKDNWQLSGAGAAEAARWAVRALIDAAAGKARGGSRADPADERFGTMKGDHAP